MLTWRQQGRDWTAVLSPGGDDQPVPVTIAATGHVRIGDGPKFSPLTWHCGEEKLDLAVASMSLVTARVDTSYSVDARAAATLVTLWRSDVWEAEIRLTAYSDPAVLRIEGTLGTVGPVAEAVHTVRWQWALPTRTGDSNSPLQAYSVHGVRHEEQSGFPVSFLERMELMRARRRYRWVSKPIHQSIHPMSSNQWLPWLGVLDDAGRGYYAGIEWSGLWTHEAAWHPATPESAENVQIFAGFELSRTFDGTDRAALPPSFVGLIPAGGLTEATQLLHRHVRKSIARTRPDDKFPWVQFNSWYPWRARLYASDMEEQLDLAAEMGVEVFVLDDGWFKGWFEGATWGIGAGWWVADEKKFPEGMQAFARKVKERGMRFGLWIEPERIEESVLQESGLDPRGLAGGDDNLPYPATAQSTGVQPCFGCPETVAWAKRQIDRLVVDYGADWIKWDHNRYRVCRRSDHGHQAGDGNWAHIRGVHEVMDYLRRRYPHVVLENCASGGNRIDYGILPYAHVNWLHDLPSPSYRTRSQFGGAVLAYPPEYHNAWVIPDTAEPLTERNARYQLRSCMLGAFGISYPLTDMSPDVRKIVAEEIANYKALRPLVVSGRFARLLPQETSLGSWGAYAYLSDPSAEASGTEPAGALLVFRGVQSVISELKIPVPGLAADTEYTLLDADSGETRRFSGTQLAEDGLRLELTEPGECKLIWIRR